jgi:enoyl-CoA hydratase/carnithine racemase
METLRLERNGPVAWLRLNRPEKLNSFTIQMWRELAELGEKLMGDDELRALVVTGEGRAFSSGIDTSVFTSSERDTMSDAGSARHPDPVVAAVLRTQDAYTWLEDAPFATIAAVRGYALGAGLQLALACDIRIIVEGTKVGLLELKYGILPDLGGTQRLPRLVGPGKAKELILTGAQIDAGEALRIGIAERVVADADLDREAGDLATLIAAQPPLAVRGVKRAVDAASRMSVHDGLLVEAENQAVCLQSDDMREAITAFVEQRPPRYEAR